MKRLLNSLVLVLLSTLAYSQILPDVQTWGLRWPRGGFDSVVYLPTGCGTPSGIASLNSYGITGIGQKIRQAAIMADTCGHHMYWFDWSDTSWNRLDGGGGGGGDSSLFQTNYRTDTAKANIRAEILLKLNIADSNSAYATWGRLYKTIDSMHLVNDARYRTPTDTSYAHLLMTRLWGYKIADSLGALISAGGTSFANPTATIGLTVVNGSLSTAMRSDAAPPISQAITPHWIAQHTFDLLPIFPVVNANTVLIGDSSANGVVPSFRKLVVKDLPKTATYPAYSTYGNFYSSSTFYSTDFVPVGDALVSSMSAGQPIFKSNSGDAFSNYVRVRTLYPTNLRHRADTIELKILDNTGDFMGVGMRSVNPASADFSDIGYIAIDASGVGTTGFLQGSGSAIGFTGTTSGITTHVNDIIRFVRTINDTVLTYRMFDLTTGTSCGTLTHTYAVTDAVKTPNTTTLTIWPFTQTNSFKMVRLSSSSSDTTNPNIMAITDSKGWYFATGFATSWVHTLQNTYGGTTFYVGGGDRLADVVTRKWEILRSNAQNLIIEDGCNDLRFGRTVDQVIADAKTIISWFDNSSTKIWFILPPEDSTVSGGIGIGLAGLHAAFLANIPNNYIATVFTSMSTSNKIKPAYVFTDGAHLSQVGNDTLANILKATGFFSILDPSRASQYQTAGPGVQPVGNKVGLEWNTVRSLNAVNHFGPDGNFIPGLIVDNGAKVVITANQNTAASPPIGTLAQVDGGFSVTGTGGQFTAQDRNDPGSTTNMGGFYEISHTLVLSNQAADVGYINTAGQLQWGAQAVGNMNGIFQIRKSSYTAPNNIGGFNGTVFNSDSIPGGITMPGTTVNFVSSNDLKGQTYTAASSQHGNKSSVLHVQKNNFAGTNYILDDDISARFDGTVSIGELGGSLRLHTPADGSGSDSVLVWSHSDSTVKKVAQSSVGGGGSSSPVIFSATSAGSALSNTTTLTSITGTGVGSKTILANTLTVGKTITMHGWFQYSTGATNTGLGIWFMESTGSQGNTLIFPASQTNTLVEVTMTTTVLTTGASGTIAVAGTAFINGTAFTVCQDIGFSFDTTINQTFDIGGKWTTASTSNSINMLPIFTIKVE